MSFAWDFIILCTRIVIVVYSFRMEIWALRGTEFTFSEFCTQTLIMRFSLMANLINMLPSLLITTTLVWEPAAIFYDLLMAVLISLMPLTVFIGIIFVTFIFIFYTIGQHQLTFDFYTDYFLDDMAGGIIREYVDGMEPG